MYLQNPAWLIFLNLSLITLKYFNKKHFHELEHKINLIALMIKHKSTAVCLSFQLELGSQRMESPLCH
jgi:hypothetical protein